MQNIQLESNVNTAARLFDFMVRTWQVLKHVSLLRNDCIPLC